jgi:hypothetical protein
MDSVYDLHSWSNQYREERLTEARVRHLEAQRSLFFLEEPAGAVARSGVLGIAHRHEERMRSEK